MGLDQFAFRVNRKHLKNPDARVDLQPIDTGEEAPVRTEIQYWRKHPNLQGWMEQLYRKNGGEQQFNCATVSLTLEDLDRLEAAVKGLGGARLPETSGFFFGSPSDDYYRDADLKFIATARQAIAEGDVVFYDSWW